MDDLSQAEHSHGNSETPQKRSAACNHLVPAREPSLSSNNSIRSDPFVQAGGYIVSAGRTNSPAPLMVEPEDMFIDRQFLEDPEENTQMEQSHQLQEILGHDEHYQDFAHSSSSRTSSSSQITGLLTYDTLACEYTVSNQTLVD